MIFDNKRSVVAVPSTQQTLAKSQTKALGAGPLVVFALTVWEGQLRMRKEPSGPGEERVLQGGSRSQMLHRFRSSDIANKAKKG